MKARRKMTPEKLAVSLLIIAVLGIVGCFSSYMSNQRSLQVCTAAVQGSVQYSTRRHSRVYYTVSGTEYSVRTAKYLRNENGQTVYMTKGVQITVHYNPENPSQAYAGYYSGNFPYFLLILSILSGIAGVFALIIRKRN